MVETKQKDSKEGTSWAVFIFVIVAVYLFGLGMPLLGPDEPRYAQVAREMFERGDWITPTLGGFNWFEKPALLYWLQIISYKLFGVSEFAARLGPALFGLLTICSLWILARLAVTENKNFANWLAIISASSLGLLVFSRGASFDIILTFPIAASLTGFFIYDQTDRENAKARYLGLFAFYLFTGVSLLAKGLIGIVFPFAIVALYHAMCLKFPGKAFFISLFWGTALSLAVAAAWYLPMYQRHGWEFVDQFFIQHHFARFTSNKYQHPQPFWFFWAVLPLMTLPWLPFLFTSVYGYIKKSVAMLRGRSETTGYNSCVSVFGFAWVIVPLVFFSFSGSKLPGYILPALPGAMILAADDIVKFAYKSALHHKAMQMLATIMFLFMVIALMFFAPKYIARETVRDMVAKADAAGYSEAPIYNLHTISHNLEFYGAGRLIRTPDGKQKKFEGVGEIIPDLKKTGGTALVLVPIEHTHQLTENSGLISAVLANNGELAIVSIQLSVQGK